MFCDLRNGVFKDAFKVLQHLLNIVGYVMFKWPISKKGRAEAPRWKMMGCWSWLHHLFFDQSQLYIIHHAGDGPETQDRGENDAAVLDIFWVVVSFFFFKFSPLFGEYSHFDSHFSKELNHQLVLVVFKSSEWFYFEAKLFAFSWAKLQNDSYHIQDKIQEVSPFFHLFPERRKNGKAGPRAGGATHLLGVHEIYIYNPWN